MKTLGLFLAIVVLLAGVSVQAQKGPRPAAGPMRQNVVVQDDAGGGYFSFDPRWGTYTCNLCEYGYVLTGTAKVTIDGCDIFVSDIQDGYRIFASVNMCDQTAKCAIEAFKLPAPGAGFGAQGLTEYWSDRDLRNNIEECPPVK